MANQKHAYLTADQTLVYLTARGEEEEEEEEDLFVFYDTIEGPRAPAVDQTYVYLTAN